MKQGDIYLVSLDPVIGSEQAKTRPCVIVSTDLVNDFANTVTVVPMSRQNLKPFVFHIEYDGSIIKLEHVRTVDKLRLVKKVGSLPYSIRKEIKSLLQLYFD
jgi:mRNA interferase MazF